MAEETVLMSRLLLLILEHPLSEIIFYSLLKGLSLFLFFYGKDFMGRHVVLNEALVVWLMAILVMRLFAAVVSIVDLLDCACVSEHVVDGRVGLGQDLSVS